MTVVNSNEVNSNEEQSTDNCTITVVNSNEEQ
jgi:hypothetical protein